MLLNTASQTIGAQMVSATDGTAFTSTVTVYVTGNGGTQAIGSVGSGVCTHEGNGFHTYAPAQAETNYAHIGFTFIGTGAVPATVQVFTRAGDAFTRLGAPAGASVSADVAAVKAVLPAALVSGRIDASVGAMAANVLTATAIASDAITDAKVASDVTIASVTGAVGSIASGGISEASFATTAGSFAPLGIVDQGTAQSATSTTLVLRSAAALADDTAIGATLMVLGSTQGYWQAREVTDYVSSTDTATVDAWTVTPSGTITYKLFAGPPAPVTAPSVNVVSISGDTGAADNAEAFFDGTGYAGTNNVIPTVTTVNGLAANVITAAATATDFGTEVGTAVWATTTRVLTAGTNLNNLSAAQVNAEVLDVLNTDTFAEPGQGAPGATVSLVQKIGYLYKAFRNRHTQTATTYSLYADDATTVDQKATVADDGTTFSRTEIATGP